MSFRIQAQFGSMALQGPPTLGLRQWGVPQGGPFDLESAALANALVGNTSDAPVLELANFLGQIEASEPVSLAIVGADCGLTLDFKRAACQSAITLGAGQVLRVGARKNGLRLYLAGPGGIVCEDRSENRYATGPILTEQRRLEGLPPSLHDGPIRVLPGPHSDDFDIELLQTTEYTITPQIDRRGIRLSGHAFLGGDDMLSEPMCVGAIQVARNGQLIILGPDGPTVGGYPVIAVVTTMDLSRLGQLQPGGRIRFELDSLRQARIGMERSRRRLAHWIARIHPADGLAPENHEA